MSFHRLPVAALILALGAAPLAALAQETVPVRFPPGASGTTINGTITGQDYIDYVLNARGGQRMTAELRVTGTNGHGSAFFNILPAGQDFGGPYTGSTDTDSRAEITVPHDGNWAIRVYLMGNDRDAGRTVGYSIDVAIAPEQAPQRPAAALLPEEDFFIVRLSDPAARLNVRNAPRPSGKLAGTVANGTAMANIGGCTISDGDQWCKVQAERGGVSGWVAARFLALPGAAAPAPAQHEWTSVTGVPAGDILNVRSGPGTGHGITGALGNGSQVRVLDCRDIGGARWCEIEMQSDMRERGWVNARYLRP
ncbi:SH3 domain-containing protein [Mangrovicoccus ximenensis]|uniref:SH3 domain-containing protein n=1 Tax=Mangrovicoccus ximenensis TaxID=1911570 RepID=UPI001F19106C|nr:SH3 domain-containing protein [Mangrovicoccus ximenensis]